MPMLTGAARVRRCREQSSGRRSRQSMSALGRSGRRRRAGRGETATRRGSGGDADWLPGASTRTIEMRYRDATRMGKIYLMPDGVARPVAGWDEQGPDADDPALTLDVWRARIAKHNGELKNLLRNQEFVAGIGNAYSDEILWEARLAPFRKRASLAPAEVDALYEATRKVLPWAIDELHELVPPRLEVEQRKFLNVHRKGGEACPRCGTRSDRGQGRRLRDDLVPRLPALGTAG